MQNHLNRLFSGVRDADDAKPFAELTLEEQAEVLAEEKAERIKFHRKSVRNGPLKFRTITTGQQRRQAARDRKTLERKANANHRRNYLRKQRDLAVLRGQLQAVGALSYATEGHTASLGNRVAAFQWLVQKFGPRDERGHLIIDEDVATKSLNSAMDAYRTATGRPAVKA